MRADFQRTLKDCRRLVADADRWVAPGKAPHISSQRHDSLVELAFFRAYLAWESLLEESFVLYLLGATVPGRRAPRLKPLGLAELVTLKPGDPRWGAPYTNVEAYQWRMPLGGRRWIMQRFMRQL